MAYFAEIGPDDVVTRVLAVPDSEEHRGQEFLADDLGLGGEWIQTSFNNRIRKQYAGIGYKYDREADVFIRIKPFASWVLDANHDWQPPKPCPTDNGRWAWDENKQDWVNLE